MSGDRSGDLQTAPTVDSWRERLTAAATVELAGFSGMELASVGAGSPVRGLVATDLFLATAGPALAESLDRARRSLAERGLAGRPVPSDDDPRVVRMPLGGDLAGIVAVRRQPALVATVSAAAPESVEHPAPPSAIPAVLAVLHGVAGADGGLFAFLEETVVPEDVHLFSLSTPEAQAVRILGAWEELERDGPAAVSVHIFVPDPDRPRHAQLVLQSGVARMSTDGVSWQRSCPDYDWPQLFTIATTL